MFGKYKLIKDFFEYPVSTVTVSSVKSKSKYSRCSVVAVLFIDFDYGLFSDLKHVLSGIRDGA